MTGSSASDDLSAWYSADKEQALATYATADSATLAALGPMLDQLIEDHRSQLEHWQEQLDLEPEHVARLEEARGEALAAWATHTETDEQVAGHVAAIGETMRRAIDGTHQSAAANLQRLVQTHFTMSVALIARKHAVRDELARRGLLPAPPQV